ncbi:MAG: HNH endonuclease [Actinobacteria bacterium]|nr:HNH endonuclease [Actinomycetota bacterium]
MPAGLDLAELMESIDPISISEQERLELIVAQRRMANHYLAQSYRQIATHFAHYEEVFPGEPDSAAQQTEVEVGTALHLTSRAAKSEFEIAWGLSQLPDVWLSFDRGEIDVRRAQILVEYLAHLADEESSPVIDQVIGNAPHLSTGQLRARLAKLCLLVNPDESKLRYEQTLDQRRVASRPTTEGTADLYGSHLPPDRVEAAYRRLTHLARKLKRRGETRTLDQIRADLLLDLVLGVEQSSSTGEGTVDIHVDLDTLAGLGETPGELLGFGPVISDIARQVTARQLDCRWSWTVTDPETGLPLYNGITRRRPRAAVRQAVEARNPHCTFPGCRMPAQRCDLDHRHLYSQGGETCLGNLVPICRRHHVVRHRFGWAHQPLPKGDHLWISPLGRHYTTSGRSP